MVHKKQFSYLWNINVELNVPNLPGMSNPTNPPVRALCPPALGDPILLNIRASVLRTKTIIFSTWTQSIYSYMGLAHSINVCMYVWAATSPPLRGSTLPPDESTPSPAIFGPKTALVGGDPSLSRDISSYKFPHRRIDTVGRKQIETSKHMNS